MIHTIVAYEDYRDFFKEVCSSYLKEINPEWPEPSIDEELYDTLHEKGNLICAASFLEEGLAGFAVYILAPSRYYKGKIVAYNDIIYVSPDCRGKGVAKGLLSFVENVFSEKKVLSTMFHLKNNSSMAKELGYTSEYIYTKLIGDK